MRLNNKRILFAAQYAAPYEGNFIAALKLLESSLKKSYDAECAYVFPANAERQSWMDAFSSSHKVYFTDNNVPKTETELKYIIEDFDPDIIHTHFDGYDVPVYNAVRSTGKRIKQIWHLHDYLTYQSNPLKKLYQLICFYRHYKYRGREMSLIAVNRHELDFISTYNRHLKDTATAVIPNGIQIERISETPRKEHDKFTFLAFGGRNCQKRIDILLNAGKILAQNREDFVITVTKGTDTCEIAASIFGREHPKWLNLIDQSENISDIFASADCFVSTSVHETFSYAIAEASIYGLPVIQSDIEGTKWNAANPSCYTFRSENVSELADAMLRIMQEDNETLKRKCQISKSRNTADYSLNAWCEKITDFYERL